MDVGPSDLSVIIFLLSCAFAISMAIFFITKKKLMIAVFVMSALSNGIFYLFKYSLFFWKYDLINFKYIVFNIWPWLNLALFIILILVFVRRKLISKND